MPTYRLTYCKKGESKIYIYDSDRGMIADNTEIKGIEKRILDRLAEAMGRLVSVTDLFDCAWGHDSDGNHDIAPHISNIRRKRFKNPDIIKFNKLGDVNAYRLNCTVEIINEDSLRIIRPTATFNADRIDPDKEYSIRERDYIEFENWYYNDIRCVNKQIAITGDGGTGKTIFAKIISECLAKHEGKQVYSDIIWVNYKHTLDDSLCNSISVENNLDRDSHLSYINSYFSNSDRKLLIIDNVIDNPIIEQYPHRENESTDIHHFTFNSLKNYGNLDVIITTRFSDCMGYRKYSLPELGLSEKCDLFLYYYEPRVDNYDSYNTDDYMLIQKIVLLAKSNALLIKKIAIDTRDKRFKSLEALYDYVKLDDFRNSSTENAIRNLYCLETLSLQEQKILWQFAILPNLVLNDYEIEEYMKISTDSKEFCALVDSGWIEPLAKHRFVMHDIIKESILLRCSQPYHNNRCSADGSVQYSYSILNNTRGFAPTYCFEELIQNMSNIDSLFEYPTTSTVKIDNSIEVLASITEYIELRARVMCYLLYKISYHTLYTLGNANEAERLFIKALECSRDSASLWIDFEYDYDIQTLRTNMLCDYAYATLSKGKETEGAYIMLSVALMGEYSLGLFEDNTVLLPFAKAGITLPKTHEHFVFPDLLMVDELNSICDHVSKHSCSSLKEFIAFARVLDSISLIILNNRPQEYHTAEEYLNAARIIRNHVFNICNVRNVDTTLYSTLIKPYEDNYRHLYLYLLQNDELNNDIYDFNFAGRNPFYIPGNDDNDPECVFYLSKLLELSKWIRLFRTMYTEDYLEIDVIESYNQFFAGISQEQSRQDLANTEDNLGCLYLLMNKLEEAEIHINIALEHRKVLHSLNPNAHLSELSLSYNNIGELYLLQYNNGYNQSLETTISFFNKAKDYRLELNKARNNNYLDTLAWSYICLWYCYQLALDSNRAKEYQDKAKAVLGSINMNGRYSPVLKAISNDHTNLSTKELLTYRIARA